MTVLRSTGQVFCRMSLCWDLSRVSLMIRLGFLAWGEEDCRDKVPFLSRLITVDADLETGFVRFLTVKLLW